MPSVFFVRPLAFLNGTAVVLVDVRVRFTRQFGSRNRHDLALHWGKIFSVDRWNQVKMVVKLTIHLKRNCISNICSINTVTNATPLTHRWSNFFGTWDGKQFGTVIPVLRQNCVLPNMLNTYGNNPNVGLNLPSLKYKCPFFRPRKQFM